MWLNYMLCDLYINKAVTKKNRKKQNCFKELVLLRIPDLRVFLGVTGGVGRIQGVAMELERPFSHPSWVGVGDIYCHL